MSALNPNNDERHDDSTTQPQPIEVAYRIPGKGWKRRTFKTEAQLTKWLEALDEDAEVRYRA